MEKCKVTKGNKRQSFFHNVGHYFLWPDESEKSKKIIKKLNKKFENFRSHDGNFR